MCDYTSIDTEDDLVLNDAIKRDLVVECSLMHHNSAHRWHYLKNQTEEDLLVFRNSDSFGKRASEIHKLPLCLARFPLTCRRGLPCRCP